MANPSTIGVICVRGPDAVSFLQGQLSQDISKLPVSGVVLSGYHNPQGRVIAVLRLARLDDAGIAAMLPQELASSVAARLGKFVLRAKVKITDETELWNVGLDWSLQARADQVPAGAASMHAPNALFRHRAAVAACQPQVYAATSEMFVSQMLNLDVLGGIAFDKGCYTGQEVIARAHYRGRVKRRMQRFTAVEAVALKPGDECSLPDGRSARVVDVASGDTGGTQFLAVTTFGTPPDDVTDAGRHTTVNAAAAPMPYALPE